MMDIIEKINALPDDIRLSVLRVGEDGDLSIDGTYQTFKPADLKRELSRLRTQLEDAEEVIDYYRSQPGHGWADNYREKYPLKDAAKDAGREGK